MESAPPPGQGSSPSSSIDVIAALRADPPGIHVFGGEVQDWGLAWEALEHLADIVEPGMATLETGCGRSSIVFCGSGASHTIVAPFGPEHERVREWCSRHGISTESLQSEVGQSQDILPILPNEPLDVALLDGSHAFPTPFVDWFYVARRLRVGGTILIDDLHVRTCRVLSDFMHRDVDRWEFVTEIGRAAVFRRTSDELIPAEDYTGQPWATTPPDVLTRGEVAAWLRAGIKRRLRRLTGRS